MVPELKKFYSEHKTETLLVGFVATVYVSTIVASATIAGRAAQKATSQMILKAPLRVNVDAREVAATLAKEMYGPYFRS